MALGAAFPIMNSIPDSHVSSRLAKELKPYSLTQYPLVN